ncbi:MAG: MMPL family transporter [Alphaproteobacteria bacterium]
MIEAEVAHRPMVPLSWQQLMSGGGDSRRLVVIRPILDHSTLHPAAQAMDAVRALAADPAVTAGNSVRVRMTGEAALSDEELQSVEQGTGLGNLLALAVACVLLVLGLRSLRLVLPVLLTLLVGLVWTTALALVMVGELNLLSVAFAVLFIGIGVDFGIHFAMRYREGISRHVSANAALRWTAETGGGPLILCAVAAAIGFFSFLPTDYRGLAELGLIAGTSMFVAVFANMTLLPALLALVPLAPEPRVLATSDGPLPPPAPPPGLGLFRHNRSLVVGAVVLALAAAILVPRVRFDFDPLHLKDPRSESVATLLELMNDPRTSPYSVSILAEDLVAAKSMAQRVSNLGVVANTATIADYLPGNQEDKLTSIANMATFLAPLFLTAPKPPPTAAETEAAWSNLLAALGADSRPAAAQLKKALEALDRRDEGVRKRLETGLLSTLPGRLEALRESLMAGPVTLADLPPEVASRMIAVDGKRTLVEVYPRESLGGDDGGALRRFVTAVRTVAPEVTGTPVDILESGDAVVRAFWTATLTTLGLLLLLLAVLLRNFRDAMLVFAPLGLAALLTVATMVVFDLAFNFANIIALPLLFGLGIANGIQFVYRERLEADPVHLMASSTPRAVIFSALTTIDSFGSMAVSSHLGTSSMGILLGLAISLTLVCTLLVLPALMKTFPPRR